MDRERMLACLPFAEHRRLGKWWSHVAVPPASFVEALRRACGYQGLTAALLYAERDGADRRRWHIRNTWWLCELIEAREGVDDVWRYTLRPAGKLRDATGAVLVGLDICDPFKQAAAVRHARAGYIKTWGELGDEAMAAHDAFDREFRGDARAAAGDLSWSQRGRIANGHRVCRTRGERVAEEAKLERAVQRGSENKRQFAALLQSHGARV